MIDTTQIAMFEVHLSEYLGSHGVLRYEQTAPEATQPAVDDEDTDDADDYEHHNYGTLVVDVHDIATVCFVHAQEESGVRSTTCCDCPKQKFQKEHNKSRIPLDTPHTQGEPKACSTRVILADIRWEE